MKLGMQIVAPFKPFPAESELHRTCAFDWLAALQMLAHSGSLACHCPVYALTDQTSDLPIPCLRVATTETRLMPWILEATAQFVRSDAFDRDTVLADVDQLIFRDLAPWFQRATDLTVLVRVTEKHTTNGDGMPVLNGVQWLNPKGKERLIGFYDRVRAVARTLPEKLQRWGADTEALRQVLEPIELGIHERAGAYVRMVDADQVLEAFSTDQIRWLSEGRLPWPTRAVVDFRWKRKRFMSACYKATILKGAVLEAVTA